jgi:CBS domain-containing protein
MRHRAFPDCENGSMPRSWQRWLRRLRPGTAPGAAVPATSSVRADPHGLAEQLAGCDDLGQPGDVPGVSGEADDVNALGATEVPATASLGNEDSDPKDTFISIFNLVNALVPDEQNVIAARPDTPVRDALELMRANGFSQLPVMERDSVIGVFSYRSFANRIASLGKVDLGRLEVDDCIEDLEFFRVTDELERTFQYLDRDGAILVGDPDQLIAVATPTDLIEYLYGLTRPFVLIQEIELVLRRLVSATTSEVDLARYIRRAVSSNYRDREDQIPMALGDLTCAELIQTVVHSANFKEIFHRVLGNNRESAWGYLGRISGIRNDIFHFRRLINNDDMQVLIDARTWLLRKARTIDARGGAT